MNTPTLTANKFVATFRCESNGIVGRMDVPIRSVSVHDDGVIEVVIDHWPERAASVGEEIMVNAAHGVFMLPLQPSGLSSGPRFVVHVPAPEQPAACRCVDCGGDQPEHDAQCAYMHSLHSGKTAAVPMGVDDELRVQAALLRTPEFMAQFDPDKFARQLERIAAALAGSAPQRYDIDADPNGIRADVTRCVRAALYCGANNVNPPPEGHWLRDFWLIGRAEASRQDDLAAQPQGGAK